jgi:hypothetical protein
VNNFKWGLSAAIFALFISILLGLIAGVSAVHVFLRALVFSVVFFGIGFGLRFIINSIFPELLYINNEEITPSENSEEGHISIAMDSMGEYAVPELFNQGDAPELGNIDDLISGVFKPGGGVKRASQETNQKIDFSISDEGIDQNKETGYNNSGAIEDISFGGSEELNSGGFNETSAFEKTAAEKTPSFQPQFTPSIGDEDDSGLGGLPDLDMMAMAFSNFSGPSPSSVSSSPPSMGPIDPVEEAEPDRGQYKGNKPQPLKGDFDPQTLAEGIRTVLSKE